MRSLVIRRAIVIFESNETSVYGHLMGLFVFDHICLAARPTIWKGFRDQRTVSKLFSMKTLWCRCFMLPIALIDSFTDSLNEQ